MPQDGRVASITLQTAVDLRVFTEYPKPAQLRLVLAFHVSLCFAFLLQDTVKIVSSHHLRQLRADSALKGPLPSLISIPPLGRSVTEGWGTTRRPEASSSRNLFAIVASRRVASITVNELPIHKRGPAPKGR